MGACGSDKSKCSLEVPHFLIGFPSHIGRQNQSCSGTSGGVFKFIDSNDGVSERQSLFGFSPDALVADEISHYRSGVLEKRVVVSYNKQLQPETVTAGTVVRQYQYNSQGALFSQTDPESGVRQITEYYSDGSIKEMEHGARSYVFRYSNRGLLQEEEISGCRSIFRLHRGWRFAERHEPCLGCGDDL